MSGGNLVYMRTLTDTPAGGASIFCAHVTSFGRGHDVGLTTADADLSLLPLPDASGTVVTYRHGKIAGEITTSQSADISGGKGFFAPPADGSLEVADGDGLIAQDIGGGHFVPVGWDVWIADYDLAFPSVPRKFAQMQVSGCSVADGIVKFRLKAPSYLSDPPLYGTRVATQIETDPVDSMNPTDPTYADSVDAISYRLSHAGLMLGSRELSIKGQASADPVKLTRWKKTTLLHGNIDGTGAMAYIPDTHGTDIGTVVRDGSGAVTVGQGCFFGVKDDLYGLEAARFDAQLSAFEMAGYHIVLSDGKWFCDLMSQPLWGGNIDTGVNIQATSGIPRGSIYSSGHYCGQWFNLTGKDGTKLTPPGLDITQVEIFAVPPIANISLGQSSLFGIARNGKVTKALISTRYADSIEQIVAAIVSSTGIIGCENIKFNVCIDGGVEFDLWALSPFSSGVTGNIHTDANNPWKYGDLDVKMGAHDIARSGQIRVAMLKIRTGLSSLDADFLCFDTSFRIDFTAHNPGSTLATVHVGFQPPFEGVTEGVRIVKKMTLISNDSGSESLYRTADPNRTYPLWLAKLDSIADGDTIEAPAMWASQNSSTYIDATLSIRDIFLWAFRVYSFSQLYPVAFPFWTKSTLVALATDGAGTIVAGGAGFATVAADGYQVWTSATLPSTSDDPPVPGRSAYGSGKFVTVGHIGATTAPYAWYSATGQDGTWIAVPLIVSSLPLRVRRVGSKFVVLFSNGSIVTSTDGVTWSAEIVTGASVAWDIAFDGTDYILFGPAGHVYKSTNLTAWVDVASPEIDAIVECGIWDATHSNFVGMGATGKAYIAGTASALAGTWVSFPTGTTGDCEDIGIGFGGLVAVGKTVGILTSNDGSEWLNPEPTAFDGGLYVSGFNCSVVWTGSAWVVGGYGLAWTYAIDKGHGTWIPWLAATPDHALRALRGRFLGGLRSDIQNGSAVCWNPLLWSGGSKPAQSWGIAFDPPENADTGTTASAGFRKICEEWWFFAGEMPTVALDGSSDQIEEEIPEIVTGDVEDVATLITVQYQPFGGDYLGKAYIQNVDVDRATAGKPDSFFFAGWDATGNTHGLAIWTACRNAYLRTGALRTVSLTYDSIHDPATLGTLWTTMDPDMGQRIHWLCERPQYLKIKVLGNSSQGALAYCGCRYKPNYFMLNGRGMPALNSTGYGVVINCDHNYTSGEHVVELAFPPA